MATETLSPKSNAPAAGIANSLQPIAVAVAKNRKQFWANGILEAGAVLVALPLALFCLAVAGDQAWHLAIAGRTLVAAVFAVSLFAACRWAWQRTQRLRMTDEEVALAMERQTPGGLQNRLINSLQLAQVANGSELHADVLRENAHVLGAQKLRTISDWRGAAVKGAIAIAVIVATLLLWQRHPAAFSNAAARVLLPWATIAPVYRTELLVQPGDCETAGDVALQIAIRGEQPSQLLLETRTPNQRHADRQTLAVASAEVRHVIPNVHKDLEYRVTGGDFSTPWFQIKVPRQITLTRLSGTTRFPDYVQQPPRKWENSTGEIEGLARSQVELRWELSQQIAAAEFVVRHQDGKTSVAMCQLANGGPTSAIAADFPLDDIVSYTFTAKLVNGTEQTLGPFAVRVNPDLPPRLELRGIDSREDYEEDATLPVRLSARDDYGLREVELVYRKLAASDSAAEEKTPWQSLMKWNVNRDERWQGTFDLSLPQLAIAVGERCELAIRATDISPDHAGTIGGNIELHVGGEEQRLQRLYEQILSVQRRLMELRETLTTQQQSTTTWLRKLQGEGEPLRWDDPQNVDQLHTAVKTLTADHNQLRTQTAATARELLPETGNLRLGLGLLADTEMARVVRILESVVTRDQIPAKQAAFADANITLERIGRSLDEMTEQLAKFRSDWELNNSVPLLKMLAERQGKLRIGSAALAQETDVADYWKNTVAKRQQQLNRGCELLAGACQHVGQRLEDEDARELAAAFGHAAEKLVDSTWQLPFSQAAETASRGEWAKTAAFQTQAAEQLQQLHAALRTAQTQAAREALAALRERAKTDAAAQREIAKLPPGTDEAAVKDFAGNLQLRDITRLRDIATGKKPAANGDDGPANEAFLGGIDVAALELAQDSGVRQDPSTLTLGNTPEKTARYGDLPPGDERNKVKPFVQEEFEDLVGALIEEADELGDNYQTLNLSTNQNNNDPGEVMKNGGRINSTGAVAATGNKKPPTNEAGGVARTGRQGARATGMVADNEAVDRRGRDQALDGQQEIADQPGKMKMTKGDDPQQDMSTGVGGKKVESDDTHFSLHDTGKWKDDYLKRMENAQAKQSIVERAGDKVDPQIAAQLRDVTSQQEQMIERLKAIKKELRTLYLPTEHLDELSQALATNLERLQARPDPELFRLQRQTLDRLRGALRVFQTAGSNFQPSLPRERAVRGRVLDQPAMAPLPGYEQAVREYYLRLAEE